MQLIDLLRPLTRSLRSVRGGVLIGEIVRRSYGGSRRIARIDDFDGDLTISLDLGEHMQSQIFWYGYYSIDLVPVLKHILRKGDSVLDCGANVGELALIASKLVGPRGRVLVFEPLDRLADQLEANIFANELGNVEVLRLGVGASEGTAPIYGAPSRYLDGTRHEGLGSLFSSSDRSEIAAAISLTSIDKIVGDLQVARIDLIKLDIEGGELAALKGAERTLRNLKPSLIVELGRETCRAAGYAPEEVFDFLVSLGYSILRIGRRGRLDVIDRDGLCDFQNLYCVSRDRISREPTGPSA